MTASDSVPAVPRLSPDEIDALGERIAETSAYIDSATHRLLTDIRAFDQAAGWLQQGALSCGHWLNWRCGIALGAAREKVRVANALAKLPAIDEALRRGEVSYSKVRAMTRVANPENELSLLDCARSSTASQLERICRMLRRVEPTVGEQETVDDRRWVRMEQTDDGMVRIVAQVTADEAALIMKACDLSARMGGPDVSAETRAGQEQASAARPTGAVTKKGDRVDGLVALAETMLRGAPTRSPVEVIFHVDADTLTGNLEDGTAVSAETCQRLLCDAGVVPVLEDREGNPLDVGRRTRSIPAAIRRALQTRDEGCCRFPGCPNRLVDAHHLQHWTDGGETKLENLFLVCRRHHILLHEGGFTVVKEAEGRLRFTNPRGVRIAGAGQPPALGQGGLETIVQRARDAGVVIDPESTRPHWDGSRPDYWAAVEGLRAH
jgi:hypothetical protein